MSNDDKTSTRQGTAGSTGAPRTPHSHSDEKSSIDEVHDDEKHGLHSGTEGGDHIYSSESATLSRVQTVDEIEEKRRDAEVHNLARRMTAQSQQSVYHSNPFESKEAHPELDPLSPEFKPRAFAKSMLNMTSRDPEKWKQRTSGFAFKDLNVYGFGSATDYQKTVVRLG